MKTKTLGTAILALALGIGMSVAAFAQGSERATDRLQNQIRRELVTLPFYSVFDNFEYKLSGNGVVTLLGQVHRPTLKSSAENVVKRIEGVTKVVNEIEVLPVSSMDDQIRLATYRSIYGHTALQTLAIRAVPPIHIIVKNGNVTLEGVVSTKLEKQVAGAQANGVAGVFSVKNNLRVEGGDS